MVVKMIETPRYVEISQWFRSHRLLKQKSAEQMFVSICRREILISSEERTKTLDRQERRQIRLTLFALVWMVVTCVEPVQRESERYLLCDFPRLSA